MCGPRQSQQFEALPVRERTEMMLGLGCLGAVVLTGFVIAVLLVLAQAGDLAR